jgi:hypothetical protein
MNLTSTFAGMLKEAALQSRISRESQSSHIWRARWKPRLFHSALEWIVRRKLRRSRPILAILGGDERTEKLISPVLSSVKSMCVGSDQVQGAEVALAEHARIRQTAVPVWRGAGELAEQRP